MADKTDAEKRADAQAEITKLKADLAASQKQAADASTRADTLQNESAGHRVAKSQAMRERHALLAVLKAHNIAFDVSKADLGALQIENGEVKGEFEYTPPAAKGADPPDPSKGDQPLTLDDVKKMTPDQINARWDEVAPLMEQQAA